ncbi:MULTISPECIES: hypothetical protein [Bacillales]|uniref:hypothetical protein n=1 Tax=Bacillales TaxID=1385 RepID=UPI00037849E2|nr:MULTISPECIES: hypothetical protein [Bacillales]KMZ44115.1 hypothetical protein AC624_25190 [Bacillus sp. FJAT-27238]
MAFDIALYFAIEDHDVKKLFPNQEINDKLYIANAEKCFIHFHDNDRIRSTFDSNILSSAHAILINHNGKQITNFDFFDYRLIIQFLSLSKSYCMSKETVFKETLSAHRRIDFRLEKLTDNKLSIYAIKTGEFFNEPSEVVINAVLPEKEFFSALFSTFSDLINRLNLIWTNDRRLKNMVDAAKGFEKTYHDKYGF